MAEMTEIFGEEERLISSEKKKTKKEKNDNESDFVNIENIWSKQIFPASLLTLSPVSSGFSFQILHLDLVTDINISANNTRPFILSIQFTM